MHVDPSQTATREFSFADHGEQHVSNDPVRRVLVQIGLSER